MNGIEMNSTVERVKSPICQCGQNKILWRYLSGITHVAVEYDEEYGMLVCPDCDLVELWPRMNGAM